MRYVCNHFLETRGLDEVGVAVMLQTPIINLFWPGNEWHSIEATDAYSRTSCVSRVRDLSLSLIQHSFMQYSNTSVLIATTFRIYSTQIFE